MGGALEKSANDTPIVITTSHTAIKVKRYLCRDVTWSLTSSPGASVATSRQRGGLWSVFDLNGRGGATGSVTLELSSSAWVVGRRRSV